jgi:putative transposase
MALIRSERGGGLTVGRMCRIVGISRPAFYRFKDTGIDRDLEIRAAMHDVAIDFPWYGYRPMTVELRTKLGTAINEKRVRRLMRLDNLLGSRKTVRKWLSPKHGFPRYANLAADVVPSRVDQLWVADLTYVRLRSSFIFVAVVLDAFSRRCVGWAIATYLRAELVIEALRMALRTRNVQPGLIHHSDQGVQYACLDYVALLREHGIEPSMSRPGMPYDNARCERFIKTLKYEEVYVHEYVDVHDARRSINHFIGVVYNRRRRHSALGYLPPAEFEASLEEQLSAPVPA